MPKASSSRPTLPASSHEFALPTSSSATSASVSALTPDDSPLLLQRFRRQSLLQKAGYISETRLHSPLASSLILHTRRRSQSTCFADESESDKERKLTESQSVSENHTSPLRAPGGCEEDVNAKYHLVKLPRTPPRRRSSISMSMQDSCSTRRLSFPIRQPRIANILAEARPEESEVKSEAAFQRFITSSSELPRTPRPFVDRGRYPEEAGNDEIQQDETSSDDEDEDVNEENTAPLFVPSSGNQQVNVYKPYTPTDNTTGSGSGDDLNMSISETSSALGTPSMDVDMPLGSPSLASMLSTPTNQWRYTPPPTASVVRSNKRKFEDRYDPYPSSSKRRAVSPSLLYLRESHSALGSPMGRGGNHRHSIAMPVPISIPHYNVSSATSSPTITTTYASTLVRSISTISSSPTLRSAALSSPIVRPMQRNGRRELEEEREIEGTGEAVSGLTLGA